MGIEDLPNGFYVPTRDEIRDQYQQDVKLRNPGAPTGEGSQAFVNGSVIADTLAPLYADALSIARDADLDSKTLESLKAEARSMGIPEILPASGGAGFVEISASAGGVGIDVGRELYDERTSLRFQCAVAGTYFDKGGVPIVGVDVGPTTNLAAGTILKWRSPPPGLGQNAKILGDGLTGGRSEESPDELRARIRSERAEPAAAGNVAHVRRLVREAGMRLGIAVQDCFVYPAILGTGTYSYVFTLRPAKPGGSRAPNATHIAQVRAYIAASLPEDDGILDAELLEEGVTCKLGIEWAHGAKGWADQNPWPRHIDGWVVSAADTATSFEVSPADPGETPASTPQVGQTIAFFAEASSTFKRKRIATVSGPVAGAYTLTIDTTNNASDAVYTPALDEPFCPWSDSLDLLVVPLALEFDELGPGEQTETFFDDGYRQRRVPLNPIEWPSVMRHKMLDRVDDLPQIGDIEWLSPDVPYATPVGVRGQSSNLLKLARVLAFPI